MFTLLSLGSHSGNIVARNGLYFMYGEHYGNSTGFDTNNAPTLTVYVSPDMVSWQRYPMLLDAPIGSYFVPFVVFNEVTQMFVAWFNAYPGGCCNGKLRL
jgi:hypothetical protein